MRRAGARRRATPRPWLRRDPTLHPATVNVRPDKSGRPLTDLFWRTSARLGDETLFSASIHDDSSVVVLGTLAGTDPISGSAVWLGDVGAYDVRIGSADDQFGLARTPITGDARLEVNVETATLDADFTNFSQGHGDMSWQDLALTNGSFQDTTIEGAFYGTRHQGLAGTFDRDHLRGAFGSARE